MATSQWRVDVDDEDEFQPPEVRALLGGIRRGNLKKPSENGNETTDSSTTGAVSTASVQDDDDDDEYEQNGKVPMRVKLAFALPNLATSAMMLPTAIHINKFYADTLLVHPGTLAIATAIARAFDTVLDPLFGWLSDSTNTRWGRRKPYIAVGAPLSALFYILLFSPPLTLTPSQAAVWFTIFFALYLIIPLTMPHHALGPELTSNYEERASLYAYSEMFALIGVIAAAAAPGIMSQYIHNPRMIFLIMSVAIAMLLIATFTVMLWVVKEPEQTVKDGNPLIPGLRRAWRNYPFRVLVLASVVGAIGQHCSSLMIPFFISYVIHPQQDTLWLSLVLLTFFGSSALSIPFWNKCAKVWDKKYVWLFGWGISVPSSLMLFFLEEGAEASLLILVFITGASFGGSSYLYQTIQADAIDYDELRTTRRREGQYITFWALIPKLVAIPAASIPLVVLGTAGYVPNRHPQTHEVTMTIRVLAALLPCVLSMMALLIAVHYPITRRIHKRITAMIARRRKAIVDNTPLPQEIDPVTNGDLPQTSGGLTTLSSEFCWYLDYFSEAELRLLLSHGQPALVSAVWWSLYLSLSVGIVGGVMVWLGGQATIVVGIMLLSISVAVSIAHALRLRAAYQFDPEKLRNFRKGQGEYFRVMTESQELALPGHASH